MKIVKENEISRRVFLKQSIFAGTTLSAALLPQTKKGQHPKRKQRSWDESIRIPFLLCYPAASGPKERSVKAPVTLQPVKQN